MRNPVFASPRITPAADRFDVASARESGDSLHAVTDSLGDAIMESVERHPYTMLAVAAGIGFVFGAIWRPL
jgi:ElaB/YqjD/DUF883 family membrane-anchored ribosome-binding protein